jgi:aromatic-L-amino-acid/L-tryptophan decarboxylase
MGDDGTHIPEETLDPKDWEEIRELGHRMVDDMLDYLRDARGRPVWRRLPDDVAARLSGPVPKEGLPPKEVYEEFRENILPYPIGNIHPRFWGWVFGTGTVAGALAGLLADTMDTNGSGIDFHAAAHAEHQVVGWCKEMLGYPAGAGGVLTSGCSGANLIGLAVARNAKAAAAGYDVRRNGLAAAPGHMVLYASDEIHSSIQKAVELLGLGGDALRRVPTNGRYQMDIAALAVAVAQDRAAGLLPFCVVGEAGTTNTGSIDDLQALADLCRQEDLWFHVDGAFGAWAALAPQARHLLAGMERADSLACDLHKWMYLPYGIGLALVRDVEWQQRTFSLTPAYLAHGDGGRGLAGGDLPWLCDLTFELSIGFRSLRAWMSLKEHGADKFGRVIQQNIDQAAYLAGLVEAEPQLELVAPAMLNVVNFRFLPADRSQIDDLNRRLVVELQEQGVVVTSGTVLRGSYAIHVANTNHRSRREDFDLLVGEVVRLGRKLAT